MPDTDRERDLLDPADAENSAPGLPRPDLNPLVNPLLGSNMGRWAQVYFTSPPAQREKAVETLVQQLQAESGEKKAAASQTSKGSDKSGAAPAREPDFELKPVVEATPPSPAQDPVATEAAEHAGSVCPGCLHKNAAEQRFCGICGMSLTRETPATLQPVPELTTRPATEGENSEADWQWLREKTLANFDTAQETKRGSRFVAGLVVFFVIAGGGYFLWQHRGFFSRRAPAPAPAA